MRNEWMARHINGPVAQLGRAPQWHCGGQGFEPLQVHSVRTAINQGGTAESSSSLAAGSARRGLFCCSAAGIPCRVVYNLMHSSTNRTYWNVEDRCMTTHRRPLVERLRNLIEMLREALQPRQPARIPVRTRENSRRR